jgi:hypothetical protein
LATVLVVASCAAPAPTLVDPRGEAAVEFQGELAVVSATAAEDGTLVPDCLDLAVRRSDASIRCAREEDRARIRFLTFERRAERAAYGVYALFDAKNPIIVDVPLDGDPIAWPNRDHVEALAYLLETEGMEPARVKVLVRENAERWFGEGLRVLLVVPLTAEDELPGTSRPATCQLALIIVELT